MSVVGRGGGRGGEGRGDGLEGGGLSARVSPSPRVDRGIAVNEVNHAIYANEQCRLWSCWGLAAEKWSTGRRPQEREAAMRLRLRSRRCVGISRKLRGLRFLLRSFSGIVVFGRDDLRCTGDIAEPTYGEYAAAKGRCAVLGEGPAGGELPAMIECIVGACAGPDAGEAVDALGVEVGEVVELGCEDGQEGAGGRTELDDGCLVGDVRVRMSERGCEH